MSRLSPNSPQKIEAKQISCGAFCFLCLPPFTLLFPNGFPIFEPRCLSKRVRSIVRVSGNPIIDAGEVQIFLIPQAGYVFTFCEFAGHLRLAIGASKTAIWMKADCAETNHCQRSPPYICD